MHSKRKFKAFLGFNWHWYLIIFTAVIFAFYYLFVTLKTPSYDDDSAASWYERDPKTRRRCRCAGHCYLPQQSGNVPAEHRAGI